MVWGGRILAAIPVLMLGLSGVMKVSGAAAVVRDFSGKFGYPAEALLPIGLLELACTIVYLVPRTAVLGAVLLTGYLGGAAATHVRAGEPAVALAPAVLGVLLWGSLFLRDARIRKLLPLRGRSEPSREGRVGSAP
jgi:uncharacterized MnhB-related membrane protein